MVRRDPCWRQFFPRSVFPDSCCDVICCYDPADDDEEEVIVYMNDPEANKQFNFPDNYIKTSKYTWYTFLPLGLAFQFTKASNVYFLLNMIFSLIPGVAPINPATAIAPLVFVLVVALLKEGIEDIKRHKADNRANSIEAEVLRNGVMTKVASRDVQAGDVMHINIGEEVRADVILLSSSSEGGQAFIDTCNLDGETNLKSRKAAQETWFIDGVEGATLTRVVLHTSAPDPGLLSWAGMIDIGGEETALSIDQFLYRGSVLRNTDSVWGMVAFAGVDTKMFRNLKERPPKSSNLDRKLNILIIVIFIIQNIFLIILCSLACWWNPRHRDHWYLAYYIHEYRAVRLWGYRYLTYFILLSYFIPISLFVTTELCKVIQAQWMRVDCEMMEYMGGRWRHCQPNTSNLNEQLAMVRFIFSDKTGTLTENVMKFKRGDILGRGIDLDDPEDIAQLMDDPSGPSYDAAHEYFLALALCHTIQPFPSETAEGGLLYEGSSPDEVALVDTAAAVGYRLLSRSTRAIQLEVNGVEKTYDVLATLEFTPDRKMMSIIVRDPDTNRITLYNKGADSFVTPQLSSAPTVQQHLRLSETALTAMSSCGLRTLMVCAKDLELSEFEAWNVRFVEAGKTLVNRSENIDKVCLEMEVGMRLVGCTAIEDRLQDQVPETLSFLLGAGVVVWMLTGDKRETAVTIAATSTLCDPRADYVDHIDIGALDPKDPKAVEKVAQDVRVASQHAALKGTVDGRKCTFVIDGPALELAIEHLFDDFLDLSQRVDSAVCCRLTPLQKSRVVRMFQKATGTTALAIGDGANDVSMLLEARVSVGIMGLEGAQAAMTADYAVPRFKHLRRLCAVHGRYSLYRNSRCILVSFYKNIVLAIIQVIFACYCGFSGLTLFDGWLLTFYNVVLTSIPPFFMGIFEKDLPEAVLMERPLLYTPLAYGQYFGVYDVLVWAWESVVHAIVIFFVGYPILLKLDATSHNITGAIAGTLMFCGMVLMVLARFSLVIRYWQWLQALGMGLSVLFFLILVLVYSAIPSLFGDSAFYFQLYNLMDGAKFWFMMIFYVGFVIVIDLGILHIQKWYFPSLRDIAQREYYRSVA